MARLDFPEIVEQRASARDEAEREELIQDPVVQPRIERRVREERLDLGPKEEGVTVAIPVERLDPDPIAGEVNGLRAEVHDADRKHPVEPGEHPLHAVVLVQVQQHLGVARAVELEASGLQLVRIVEGVVGFAVIGDEHLLV